MKLLEVLDKEKKVCAVEARAMVKARVVERK